MAIDSHLPQGLGGGLWLIMTGLGDLGVVLRATYAVLLRS
jgi:hypothetical protein